MTFKYHLQLEMNSFLAAFVGGGLVSFSCSSGSSGSESDSESTAPISLFSLEFQVAKSTENPFFPQSTKAV